jgi:tetratricopeptide (TPR) repeat protein
MQPTRGMVLIFPQWQKRIPLRRKFSKAGCVEASKEAQREMNPNRQRQGRRMGGLRKENVLGILLAAGSISVAVSFAALARPSSPSPTKNGQEGDRFDTLVREDFFAGFAGDMEAFQRGMKACEEALAKNPKNAQALVWHGSGLNFEAKDSFMAGDFAMGRELQGQGEKEMNDAVEAAPDDVAVLIPRAATMLSAATHTPFPPVAQKDFQVAADDYEKVLRLQAGYFSGMPVHSRGELLGGLAEAWNGLGNAKKSRAYLQRMMKELPNTVYGKRAKEILAAPAAAGPIKSTCLSCHATRTSN